MATILASVALVLYLVTSGLHLLVTMRDERRLLTPALWTLGGGMLANAASLGAEVAAGGGGSLLTIQSGFSLLALLIGGGFVALRQVWRLHSIGVVAAPLMMLLQAVFLVSLPGMQVSAVWRGALLTAHIALALFGTASFALAALTGLFYLVQDRNLREKKFGPLFSRLPSVDVLDKVNLRLILLGFPVYTLAIGLGTLWAWDNARSLQVQYVFAMVSWLIYAAILNARITIGWRGRRAAVLTQVGLLGVVAVLSTYLARAA